MTISKIYIDFDDTLADFSIGAEEVCSSKNVPKNTKEMWDALRQEKHFYRSLGENKNGIQMFHELFEEYGDNLEILAVLPRYGLDESKETQLEEAPSDNQSIVDEKKIDSIIRKEAEEKDLLGAQQDILSWIESHVSEAVKVHFVKEEKEKLQFCKGKEDLLIDDCKDTVDQWKEKEGISIRFNPDIPGEAEEELKILLTEWECPYCGERGIHGRHCPNCGREKPKTAKVWECLECGTTGLVSDFCPNCGASRTLEEEWICEKCGRKGNDKAFCPDCGYKNPKLEKDKAGWSCKNGHKDIMTAYCPDCGKRNRRYKKKQIMRVETGKYVKFGRYFIEKDSKKTAIEWYVAETKGNYALLISKYALDSAVFNSKAADNSWKNSTLRHWLNHTFYRTAFSFVQRCRIANLKSIIEKNPEFETEPSEKNSREKVTILSIAEVTRFFKNEMDAICESTPYARAHRSGKAEYASALPVAANWWLRSPGFSRKEAAQVYQGGAVDSIGKNVRKDVAYIRPAIWIKVKM